MKFDSLCESLLSEIYAKGRRPDLENPDRRDLSKSYTIDGKPLYAAKVSGDEIDNSGPLVRKKEQAVTNYDPNISLTDQLSNKYYNKLVNVLKTSGFQFNSDSFPQDGTYLYRGHRTMDPFSKGPEDKAGPGSLYFSNNASYALGYAVYYNPGSEQVGQAGLNNLQWLLIDNPKFRKTHGVGFFTVAKAKNPDAVKFYSNFGHEDSQKRPDEAPSFITRKDFSSPKENNYYINNVDTRDMEAVVKRDDIASVRTYLAVKQSKLISLISLKSLQKVEPELFELDKNSIPKKANDPTRVY